MMTKSYEINLAHHMEAPHDETLNHALNASATRSIATARRGELAFLDIERREMELPFDHHCGDMWGVALSAVGPTALTVGALAGSRYEVDHWYLGLWNTDTAEALGRFEIPPFCYRSAASADLRAAMLAHRGTISWWDTESRRVLGSVKDPHLGDIWAVTVSDDGALAASTCTEQVFLWDVSTRAAIQPIALPRTGVLSKRKLIGSIRFLGGHLYLGSNDGRLWAADPPGASLDTVVATGHPLWVLMFDIHDASGLAALVLWGGRLELWHLPSGTLVGMAETGHEQGSIRDLRITPNGDRVVTAGADGKVRVWALRGTS
jgi:hypothetical protein